MVMTQEDSGQLRAVLTAMLAATVFVAVTESGLPLADGRQWGFHTDMNGDGRLTIRDAAAIVHWIYFYPGDLVICGVRTYLYNFAAFFEITSDWYGGVVSFLLSIIGWPLVAFSIYGVTFLPGVVYGYFNKARASRNRSR